MSQQQTTSNNKKRNNKGRYRNNNNNKNKSNNNNRKNNNRRRRNGKPNSINLDPLFRKYTVLLEELIQARKKYFEFFHRGDQNRKAKLERVYEQKLEEINKFHDALSVDEKNKINEMFPTHSNDYTYSENHNLNPEERNVEVSVVEDPHFLESQKQANFTEDTEESVGTLEDYKAYKGI